MIAMAARTMLAIALLTPACALAFSAGSTDCATTQHGSPPQAGNGGFALTGPAAYTPGAAQTIALTGAQSFKGLLMFALDGGATRRGTWLFPAGYRGVVGCVGGDSSTLTHNSSAVKTVPVPFTFTAPPAGTGPITIRAIVLTDFPTFFIIQLDLPEAAPVVDEIFVNGFEGVAP